MEDKRGMVKPKGVKYSVIVNAVVANKSGRILITQRGRGEEHGPGTWSIPGGRLEYTGVVHDALRKTARKEVWEETGIEVEGEMSLLANNTFRHNEDRLQVVAIVFLCRYKSGKPHPREDTAAVRWISREEVNRFKFHNINVKNYVRRGFERLGRREETGQRSV